MNFNIPDLSEILNKNGKKFLKNILSGFMPKSLAEYTLKMLNLTELRCFEINKNIRHDLENFLSFYYLIWPRNLVICLASETLK